MISVIQRRCYAVVVLLGAVLGGWSELTYAITLPKNIKLQYVDAHGLPVEMVFNHDEQHYSVNTKANVLLYSMNLTSKGQIVGNQLHTKTYEDRRSGRLYARVAFDGQTIRYGKASEVVQQKQLNGSVYDVVTLAWQLALNDGKAPKLTYVTNGKKFYPLGGISYLGTGNYLWNQQQQPINQYRLQHGKNTIEYAFMPALANIPVKISYTDHGRNYVFKLKKAQLDGKVTQSQ